MMLKQLQMQGFKSFAEKTNFYFTTPITAIVGPNGSGKSNVVEAVRFVLGEQSSKSLRTKSGADLIFAGSETMGRMNRASVSIVFDNRARQFSLTNVKNENISVDFDEVIITREVYTDGTNNYKINDQQVRLRDIHELIASVNLGSSGHHIISQGEADRLLNANPKERKAMIEDALGLKMYHFRINETEKKLTKTKNNLEETNKLRREVAPRLQHLEREVAQIRQAEELRGVLRGLYQEYLYRKYDELRERRNELTKEREAVEQSISQYESLVEELKQTLDKEDEPEEFGEYRKKEQELKSIQQEHDELARKLGRLEGTISALEEAQQSADEKQEREEVSVSLSEVQQLVTKTRNDINSWLESSELEVIKDGLRTLDQKLQSFVADYQEKKSEETGSGSSGKLSALRNEYSELESKQEELLQQRTTLENELQELSDTIQQKREHVRSAERSYYEQLQEKQKKESELSLIQTKEESLKREERELSVVREDAYGTFSDDELSVDESITFTEKDLAVLHREIERNRIKLEEIGGGAGTEVIEEYEEVKERDEFLQKEVTDLESSIEDLNQMIEELREELHNEFQKGIKDISKQFQEFFALLFGGGTAKVELAELEKNNENEKKDDRYNIGVELSVSLPKKKIKNLGMLSGGERSLTSIALLFALSQVNPPPFLVLDETDAALDEANSARYGSMLEELSQYSQLIVVTHNRETMARAGRLYGVTMGGNGCSQLLSIQLEQASQYAK